MTRRYNFRSELQRAKHLVKKDTPITEFLFGDNLNEEIKRIDTAEKMKESMKFKSSDKGILHNTKPYTRNMPNVSQNNRLAQIRKRAKDFLVKGGHHGFSQQVKKTPYHQASQPTQYNNQFYQQQQQQKSSRPMKHNRGRGRGSRTFHHK